METKDFVKLLSDVAGRNIYRFNQLRDCLPLGIDGTGSMVVAHKEARAERYHLTCVMGEKRCDFIMRTIMTLACLYNKEDAQFFLLSPRREYAELLRLKSANITVPYIDTVENYKHALGTLSKLLQMRSGKGKFPELFVVADGLEELPDAPKDNTRSLYSACFDMVQKEPVQVLSGVELSGSIFSAYPGTFVGVGNCLISAKSEEKATIAYVNMDSSLTVPKEFLYPSAPSVSEAIDYFNNI